MLVPKWEVSLGTSNPLRFQFKAILQAWSYENPIPAHTFQLQNVDGGWEIPSGTMEYTVIDVSPGMGVHKQAVAAVCTSSFNEFYETVKGAKVKVRGSRILRASMNLIRNLQNT